MRKVNESEIRITNDVTQNEVMGIIFLLAGLGLLFFVAIPDKS